MITVNDAQEFKFVLYCYDTSKLLMITVGWRIHTLLLIFIFKDSVAA